jgi:lipoate-protein ligase A
MSAGLVIVEPQPARGSWNMAVDEALLEAAVESGQAAVRWYRWADPTLSLGYFQKPEDAPELPGGESLAVVRRLSGGGAILHHHELTYSCVLPAGHPLVHDPHQLYVAVHDRIIAILATFGIEAARRGNNTEGTVADAFLCFARGDECDVVCRGQKILGSAQRRRRGAVLQHGSLVLRRSAHAPQFAGAYDLAELESSADVDRTADLLAALARGLAEFLPGAGWRESIDELVSRRAQEIETERQWPGPRGPHREAVTQEE